jgi:putative endonuclease
LWYSVIPRRDEVASPESIIAAARDVLRYLLASGKHGTLYLGVTRDLVRRVYEHKTKVIPGFTSRYDVNRLVWYEIYDDPVTAITREKGNQEVAA